jgi:hypothetical protein
MVNYVRQYFSHLEDSLGQRHPSMDTRRNPVLTLIDEGKLNAGGIEEALSQYSLLPKRIVHFLSAGASRLQAWEAVGTELRRNIGEEEGSRTDDIPHYVILKDALRKELALDVQDVRPAEGTRRFLDAVDRGLTQQPAAFVAGMLYALEDSAVPELAVVASIINRYAMLTGRAEPINLAALTSGDRKASTPKDEKEKYSLNSFFASHMLDFEVGHRNGLASAIQGHIPVAEMRAFEDGFEYVLDEMDVWWKTLAGSEGQDDLGEIKTQKEGTHADNGALTLVC